jgi:hypothetical protein
VEWPQSVVESFRHYPTDAAIRQLPISIAASEVGDFASGYSWYLSVNSAGQADLTIENNRKARSKLQQFTVSKNQLDELRELLVFHAFFALDEEYGEIVPDGSMRTLTITAGDYSKTIRIHYLMNWVQTDKDKLREPARALAVWNRIRGWFQHPEAVDTRRYDQRIINAIRGNPK